MDEGHRTPRWRSTCEVCLSKGGPEDACNSGSGQLGQGKGFESCSCRTDKIQELPPLKSDYTFPPHPGVHPPSRPVTAPSPIDKPLPSPPVLTVTTRSPSRQSRSLIDASEKPLQRRSPTDPERLEEWPVLDPRKHSPSPSLDGRSIKDGELAIIEQLRLKPVVSETDGRADEKVVGNRRSSSTSSTGTVLHNTDSVEANPSKELNGILDESTVEKAFPRPLPNGSASPGHEADTPEGQMRAPLPKKRLVSTELPPIRQTRTSSLRASLAASRSAEHSPTAIALDRDGDYHRPIRGTRIPLKPTSEDRPSSIPQSRKGDANSKSTNGVVRSIDIAKSEPRVPGARSATAPSANDSVKRRSSVFDSTKPKSPLTPLSSTLPRSFLPTAASAKKAQNASSRHARASITPFNVAAFGSNSPRSRKQANRNSKSTLEISCLKPPSTQLAADGDLLSDHLTDPQDGGHASIASGVNGSPKVRPSAESGCRFTVKRLSQANPDYGPTLKIHSSAERLIMGDEASSDDFKVTPSIDSDQQTPSSSETIVYSAMATGRAQMMRSMSQLERDALRKKLHGVANSAEKRSITKKEPVLADGDAEEHADRKNKFRRNSAQLRESGNATSNDRAEERKPLLEPLMTAVGGITLSEDPFIKEQLDPVGDGSGLATFEGTGVRDFSDVAAPGKEAHWISPLPERRASLQRYSTASTSMSRSRSVPELPDAGNGWGENAANGKPASDGPSVQSKGKKVEASGALDSYTSASSSGTSPVKEHPIDSPISFPARKSSRMMVPDYTKSGPSKSSPPAPSFQHNPPKEYVERQNRLGADNGMESIEKSAGTETQCPSMSKRDSVAEISAKSRGSVSRSIKKHVRGLFQKGNLVTGTFRHGQPAKTANCGFTKEPIGKSRQVNQSPRPKPRNKRPFSRPSILPEASALPRMSQIHPVHRPRIHAEINKASPMSGPRPLHRARISSEPGNMFRAAMNASGRNFPTRSGVAGRARHTMPSAWPLPPGVDPLSPAGLAAARVAQQQGRYHPRGKNEIEGQLDGCSRTAQTLAAKARRPDCPTHERQMLLDMAAAIMHGLTLSRVASVAADDAEQAAFKARAAFDECAKNVDTVAQWARDYRRGTPTAAASAVERSRVTASV